MLFVQKMSENKYDRFVITFCVKRGETPIVTFEKFKKVGDGSLLRAQVVTW